MPLTILPIVVPPTYGTYGPILDVSVLRGEKTVLLDGSFDGLYVLYGSHDNANFVPVFSFFGARPQSIKQIFESSYLSVRLRSLATNAAGVSISISGEFSASTNSFAPLPLVPAGAYGPQAVVDLFALVPPSGLLSGTNVILTGNFVGSVSVEGSLDGVRFSPVAVFKNLSAPNPNSGLQPAVPQNGPAPYTQQVRYLRVNVLEGTFVLGTLFATVGGETESTATSSTFLSEPVLNGTGTQLLAGEVVRISADETVVRAKADVVGNVRGLVGAMLANTPAGFIEDVVNSGRGFVLLETGLTVAAGDQLWVSASTSGRATNVMPALQAPLGIVKDASPYAATGGVVADVNPGFTVAASVPSTLHQSYGVGVVLLDQTLSLLDANGGGVVVDGTAVGFTGASSLAVSAPFSGAVLFPRAGGLSVVSTVSVAAAAGSTWNEVDLQASTLTLTGGPAVATKVSMVRVGQGTVNGPGNTVTDAYDLLVDAAPVGSASLTRLWSAGFAGAAQAQAGLVLGTGLNPPTENDLVVGTGATVVSEANSGRLGYVAGATQKFVVSQNGGAYVQLLTSVTLAQAYGFGTVAADQTLTILDANGGGLVVDGTAAGFTGTNSLTVRATSSGTVLFPRVGGLSVVSTVSVAAAAGSNWNEIDLQASTLTLTGGPAVATKVSMVHVGQGTINGAGNTVTDAYNQLVDAAPAGTATLTRSWSIGFAGAAQAQAGLVLGTGLNPPTENDLVVGAGATVVSQANSGRLGYLAGATQKFMVSMNGAAYVPLVTGAGTLAASYNLGTAAADQTLALLDIKGGKLVIDGTSALFTDTSAVSVLATNVATIGTKAAVAMASTFAPTTGVGNYNVLFNSYTINQTGGSSGTVNGILVNATETSVGGIHYLLNLQISALSRFAVDRYACTTIAQPTIPTAGTLSPMLSMSGGALSGLTIHTEHNSVMMDFSATKTWNTGSLANQREIYILAPTYAFNAASVITNAATCAIAGLPVLGTNATFTRAFGLWITGGTLQPTTGSQVVIGNLLTNDTLFAPPSGNASFYGLSLAYNYDATSTTGTIAAIRVEADNNVADGTGTVYLMLLRNNTNIFSVRDYGSTAIAQTVVNTGITPAASLSVTGAAHSSMSAGVEAINANFNFSATKTWSTGAITTQREFVIQAPTYAFDGASTITTAATFAITGAPAAGTNATITTPLALWVQTGSSQFVPTQTIANAAGANWNGLGVAASTLTITGAGTITTLSLLNVIGPTITSASAAITTDFYTARLGAATFTGTGPASATRSWSLYVEGNVRLGAGQTVAGTDVNVAGPYTVLATDFFLKVLRTATAPITINLPALTGGTQLDGRLIPIKDSGYNADVNAITLALGNAADKIENVNANYVFTVHGGCLWLRANLTTNNWEFA